LAEANIQLLATALNITPRRIQQLVKEGVLPKAERGVYEIVRCMQAYIRFLQASMQKRQDEESRDETVHWTRERTRLAREQADSSQLKNAELRGELVRLQVVERLVGQAMAIFRTNTLALSSKLSPSLEGRTAAEIKTIIDREARRLLEGIASFDFRTATREAGADARVSNGAAAASLDSEPVGRSVPVLKPRSKRGARQVAD
jgi:phage terminase Nu1 subunit (DNA packaging protein)